MKTFQLRADCTFQAEDAADAAAQLASHFAYVQELFETDDHEEQEDPLRFHGQIEFGPVPS